jgi:hypothetical protein
MWNGMNFASDVGRAVIETYVKTPATSSILGFPRNYHENEHLATERGSGQRRPARSTRGPRSIAREAPPAGLSLMRKSYRSEQAPSRNSRRQSETSEHGFQSGGMVDTSAPPPRFQLPAISQGTNLTSNTRPFLSSQDNLPKDGLFISTKIHRASPNRYMSRAGVADAPFSMLPKSNTEPALQLGEVSDSESSSPFASYRQLKDHSRYTFARPMQNSTSEATHAGNGLEQGHYRRDDYGLVDHTNGESFVDAYMRAPHQLTPPMLSPVGTPTRRPTQRINSLGPFATSVGSASTMPVNTRQKEAQLRSRLHLLLADKFAVDGRLAEGNVERHVQDQLFEKRKCLLHNIHEIEQELMYPDQHDADSLSFSTPARRGSYVTSNGIASPSGEIYNISSMSATDHGPLHPASKNRSGQLSSQDAPAPPAYRRKHGFTPSWDLRMAGAITKLVSGSEDDFPFSADPGLGPAERSVWHPARVIRPRTDSSLGMYQDTNDSGGIVTGDEFDLLF